jgi:putative addiction module CopG family antidote
MSTLSIQLERSEEHFIHEAIKSGRYASETEVVSQALADLKAREDSIQNRVAEMRTEVLHGLAQLDRGDSSEFDVEKTKEEGRRRFAERRLRQPE